MESFAYHVGAELGAEVQPLLEEAEEATEVFWIAMEDHAGAHLGGRRTDAS